MIVKVLINVLINLGIFTLGMCVYWSFNNQHYPLMAGTIFALVLLIFMKIRLVKSVREQQQKK
ncbi:MAG: DUF6358 family protein [Sphingobacteriaceae bacterium]